MNLLQYSIPSRNITLSAAAFSGVSAMSLSHDTCSNIATHSTISDHLCMSDVEISVVSGSSCSLSASTTGGRGDFSTGSCRGKPQFCSSGTSQTSSGGSPNHSEAGIGDGALGGGFHSSDVKVPFCLLRSKTCHPRVFQFFFLPKLAEWAAAR